MAVSTRQDGVWIHVIFFYKLNRAQPRRTWFLKKCMSETAHNHATPYFLWAESNRTQPRYTICLWFEWDILYLYKSWIGHNHVMSLSSNRIRAILGLVVKRTMVRIILTYFYCCHILNTLFFKDLLLNAY